MHWIEIQIQSEEIRSINWTGTYKSQNQIFFQPIPRSQRSNESHTL